MTSDDLSHCMQTFEWTDCVPPYALPSPCMHLYPTSIHAPPCMHLYACAPMPSASPCMHLPPSPSRNHPNLAGVLAKVMREVCGDESLTEKWLLLDGPVDTLWIESMNTVLDDNKLLTLINGERIAMPPQVSLLFEVEDLSVASPATVSRAGMVYVDDSDMGWKPYVADGL